MNIVILKGRLTRDSEIREFQGGGKVLSNALALSRVWYDQNKNKHEETDFVDIKANNGTADFIAKWFKKGDGISIEGRLKQESWQDKETGANRSRIVVVVENAHFELGRSENGANGGYNTAVAQNGGYDDRRDVRIKPEHDTAVAVAQNTAQIAQNIANSGAVMGVTVTNYADSTAQGAEIPQRGCGMTQGTANAPTPPPKLPPVQQPAFNGGVPLAQNGADNGDEIPF